MAVTVVRLPRSFAGDKAASLEDFFNSMAHALSRGDPARKEAIQHFCNRVQVSLTARAVFDVGGLQKMSRKNMLQLLVSIEKDSEHWVDSIEDVLDFSFPTPVITHLQVGRDPALPPLSAALVPQSIGGLRTSSYVKEGELGLGAQLLSNGMLDTVVFKYAMFTKLVTSSPLEETITEAEVTHINDTVFEMTFTKYGRVTVDKIYRTHCGQKLRLLFPNLPNRGKIMGEDRKFEDMLKWRFSNARKSPVEGKIPYKAGMIIDRINLCQEAITMVDQMNFRLTVVNEGKLDTKFSIDDVDDDEGLDEMPKEQTEDDGKDNPNPRPIAKRQTGAKEPAAIKKAKVAPRTEPVPLFKQSGLPLKALPFKKVEVGNEIVICVPYMGDDGTLIPEYWYGVVSHAHANASWIKFYDVTDDPKKDKHISWEKHKLLEKDYFDKWMLVEKVAAEELAVEVTLMV